MVVLVQTRIIVDARNKVYGYRSAIEKGIKYNSF